MKQFIKAAGNKVGIDLAYFLSASLWTSIPTFTELFLNILASIVFATVLGAAAYGQYQFFISVITLLSLFALSGNTAAIISSVSKGYDKSFVDATRAAVLFSLLGSAAALAMSMYFYFVKAELTVLFAAAALFFPFIYSMKSYIAYLTGKEEFKRNAHIYTLQLLFVNACLIGVVLFTRSVSAAALTYLVVWSVSGGAIYLYVKHTHRKSIAKSSTDSHLIKYSIHLTLMQIAPIVSSQLDKILIAYYLGFKVVALYAIAQNIAQLNQLALKPALRIVLPKLSKSDPYKTYVGIRKKLIWMLALSGIICFANIILTPIVVHLLFPAEYAPLILYAQLLVFAYITNFATVLFQNYLAAHRWTKSQYKVSFITAAIKVVLLIALLPFFGVWGAITAFIAASFAEFFVSFYYSSVESSRILRG